MNFFKTGSLLRMPFFRKPLLLAMGILLVAGMIFVSGKDLSPTVQADKAAANAAGNIEGLWAYETLIIPTPQGKETAYLTGHFIFHNGYFLQHSINNGEPFAEQGGMAHAGTYSPIEKGFEITVETGMSTEPKKNPGLDLIIDKKFTIVPEFSEDRMVLTFGGRVVQTFKRVKITGTPRIIRLNQGYMSMVDNRIILVTAKGANAVAGYGTYKQNGNSLTIETERWFSVVDNKVANLKNKNVEATFDGKVLTIAGGPSFQVVK